MTDPEHTSRRSPSLAIRGGLAVVLSVMVNVGIVFVTDALAIAPGFRAVTIPPVAFLSAFGAGGATVVYWVIDRYVTDAGKTFVRIATAVLILSFVPDVGLLAVDPVATPLAVVVLMVMHVVVAAVSVWLLVQWRLSSGLEQM